MEASVRRAPRETIAETLTGRLPQTPQGARRIVIIEDSASRCGFGNAPCRPGDGTERIQVSSATRAVLI